MRDEDQRELERKAALGDEEAEARVVREKLRSPQCGKKHLGPWRPVLYRSPAQKEEDERRAEEAIPYVGVPVYFAQTPMHEQCDYCGARRPHVRIYTNFGRDILPKPTSFIQRCTP